MRIIFFVPPFLPLCIHVHVFGMTLYVKPRIQNTVKNRLTCSSDIAYKRTMRNKRQQEPKATKRLYVQYPVIGQ